MRIPVLLFRLFLAAAGVIPGALGASWSAYCLPCEKHLGGNSRIGPMDTQDECEKWRRKSLDNNYPYTPCVDEGGSSGASSSSSDSALQESTSRALSFGLANGNAEALGLGMMGLGVMALTSGPSAEQLAAQRRAAQAQADQEAAAQVERRRRVEAGNLETLDELKGGEAATYDPRDFGLKGDGTDDLKDSAGSTPKRKKKVKKPFNPPRLRPVPNPLHKQPLIGDFDAATEFNDLAAARAFANANGGTVGQESTGKIVACDDGFPYYCDGLCYSEAAFNDFRIPCASKLRTTKP